MGSGVQVFSNPRGGVADDHRTAQARVRLKLAALGYYGARNGADGGPGMCWDALVLLCRAAVSYVCALQKNDRIQTLLDKTIEMDDGAAPTIRTLRGDGELPPGGKVAAGRTCLKVAAIAYCETRHGADGGAGFSRDGLGLLCQMAIRYVETLDGQDRSKVVDTTLPLDSGM